MSVFDLFTTSDYTFLELDSKTGGKTIVNETDANGIVKLRDGMIQADNMEQRVTTSDVYIRPTEPFVDTLGANLVGHGVRIAKGDYASAEYRIESQVEGFDFDTGAVEFYKVTLSREGIWDESELPLE